MGKGAGRVRGSEQSDFLLILGDRVSWGRYEIAWYVSFHIISVSIPDLFPGYRSFIKDFSLQSMEDLDTRPQESVFQFETENLELLPIRDLALFGHSDLAEDFGFTIGPVCFS